MEPTPVQRALDLLQASLDLPEEARKNMLAAAAAADPAVGAELRRLDAGQLGAERLMATDPGGGSAADDPPPPEQIGVFRLLRLLGRGGMGAVYEAVRNDGLFEQRVAIKLLAGRRWSQDLQQRFANERQILARLEQRNIARIYDGGVAADGHSYIVMEYIDGQSIIDYSNHRALDLPGRLALMLQLCGALQFAHQQLVVHADIKPNNVLVTSDGSVKLLDFGISQLLDRTGRAVSTSSPGSHEPLTAAYAAPERAAGGPPTVAGDVYSLGVVLRELLTASEPSTLSSGLAAVIAEATANDPVARYGSVASLAGDLRRWLRNVPLSAVPDSWRYRARLFLLRNRAAVVIGAFTFLGLSVTTALSTRSYFTAENARRDAERAREAEAERFEEARSLSSYLVNDLSDEMLSRPGMSDAHRKAMNEARSRLLLLAANKPHDASLQIEIARDIAAIASNALSDARHSPERIPQVRKDVVTVIEQLARLGAAAASLPNYWEIRSELQALQADAALIVDGDAAAAMNSANAAVALAAEALRRRPGDPDATSAVIAAQTALANALMGAGRLQGAIDLLGSTTRGFVLAGAAVHASTPRLSRAIIEAEFHLCEAKTWHDADAAALKQCTGLQEQLRQILRERGASTFYETELAYTLFLSATLLPQPARSADALRMLNEAHDIYTRILHFGEDDVLSGYLLVAQSARAVTLAKMGQFQAARIAANDLLLQRRTRLAADPPNHGKKREVAIALRRLGEVEQLAGQRTKSCAAFAESGAIWDQMQRNGSMLGFDLAEKSGQVPAIRRRLATCLRRAVSTRMNGD